MTPIYLDPSSIKLMTECRDAAERIVYRMDERDFAERTTEKDQQAHQVMLALFNAHLNK